MPCFTEEENCFVVCVRTYGYKNQALVTEVFPKQILQSLAKFMNLLDKLPYHQTITPWFLQRIRKVVNFSQVWAAAIKQLSHQSL